MGVSGGTEPYVCFIVKQRGLVCAVPLRASYKLTGSDGPVKLVNQFLRKKVLVRDVLEQMPRWVLHRGFPGR